MSGNRRGKRRFFESFSVSVWFLLFLTSFAAVPASGQELPLVVEAITGDLAVERLGVPRLELEAGRVVLRTPESGLPRIRSRYQKFAEEWVLDEPPRSPSGPREAHVSLTEAEARGVLKNPLAPTASREVLAALKIPSNATLAPEVLDVEAAESLGIPADHVIVASDVGSIPHLRQAYPKQLVMLQRTPFLDGLRGLDRAIAHVRFHVAVPSSDVEFFAVYGREATPVDRLAMEQAAKDLEAFRPARKGTDAPDLRHQIQSSVDGGAPDTVDVVIAHNDNGVLRLPDGTSVGLSELNEVAAMRKTRCVVVSCNTLGTRRVGHVNLIGTTDNIRLTEAAPIARGISPVGGKPGTARDMLARLQRVAAVVGVAGTALIVVDPKDAQGQ